MNRPPNILWLVTTQWRAQACGYAGDPNARTPHLDRLAAQSVNFSQAVTPHPFGPFARAALLTGVPSPQNGVRDYFDPLPVDARTVAHDLGARGYATAFFGKWHLAERNRDVPLVGEAHARTIVAPAARGGFELWEGFEGGFLLNDPWLHGTRLEGPRKFEGYQSDVLCARAGGWIREQDSNAKIPTPTESRPWFCMVSLEPPHPPYAAPAAGVAGRDPQEMVLPPNVPRGGEVEAKVRQELAGYHAHIEATDRAMGRLVAELDEAAARRGRRALIVVFTSVHGDMHGAHGLFRKGWPHEESVRVPLLVRGVPRRGGAARAGVHGQVGASGVEVSLIELARLTLAWADGETAFPDRRSSLISMPAVVALPHQCDRTWRAVRTRTRKLVLNADGSPWLLFDLDRDPWELNNLAADPAWAAEVCALRKLTR